MQVTRKIIRSQIIIYMMRAFLRVKTIQLGYTIPKNLIPKVRIRAYCNLEKLLYDNIFYPEMDPKWMVM